ncbi:MAG TPA: hypothetical protein PLP17_16215 [Oligoflexia bacterium]|nr:hypothetical protein [Oligoflexia bacterium]
MLKKVNIESKKKRSKWIGARISWELFENVNRDAKEKGITFSEVVREKLETHYLRGAKLDEMYELLREILRAIKNSDAKTVSLVTAILVVFGNHDPETARRWVLNNSGK